MKTIVLVRHAKSSWADAGMRDFDRPLNHRGLRDATVMGKRMNAIGLFPDLIVSSPAERAHTTAFLFAQQLPYAPESIVLKEELYHAPPPVFTQLICSLENSYNTVYIFAHNNGISEFADRVGVAHIDAMPTCAVFAFQLLADTWDAFPTASKKFLLFDRPKDHAD